MILGIYGTGGAGYSVLELAEYINNISNRWKKIFFIDDFNFDRCIDKVKVISFKQATQEYSKDDLEISISVGEPESRASLKKKIKDTGCSLASIIHPNTHISKSSRCGEGLILREGARIMGNCIVGENNSFESYSILSHDCKMGDNCQLSSFTSIAGNCIIGSKVFFGAGSAAIQGTNIGSGSIISMGAMVFKDVPSEVIVSGNPARVLQKNIDKKVFR